MNVDQIVGIVEQRRRGRGPVIEMMRRIRDIANSDIVVPLPEMDDDERPAVPNLILQGIEQNAARITSVEPALDVPPGQPWEPDSRQRAERRRNAILGWWESCDLELASARRARWLVGYGCAPAIIRPDFETGLPYWEIRDPLDAYPPPPDGNPARDLTPRNCAFIHRQSFQWLRERYPNQAAVLCGRRNPNDVDPSELFEILEWIDEHETVLIGMANQVNDIYSRYLSSQPAHISPTVAYLELDRSQTLIGMCPVVIPGRITLDRPRGQMDSAIGMYSAHAKLMALGMIGVERDVFPDIYLVGRQAGETPRFITGPHDGRTGLVNEVEGLPQIIQQPIGALTTNFLDRIERGEGITIGSPAEYGGESNTNIRTGRRGEQVMDAILSYPLAEAQRIMAKARAAETVRAQAVVKAWFGDTTKTIFVTALRKSVTYTPSTDFDSDVVSVVHPMAGTDANNLTVMLNALVGGGMSSRISAMRKHPLVDDAETEHDLIIAEQLEQGQLAALLAQAQAGGLQAIDMARIAELVKSDRAEIFAAVQTADREARERQASSGPPGTPTGPVPEGAPEAQPGLAPPGQGAEAPQASQPASLQDFLASISGGA